ncbi:hypothetical protein AAGQ96_04870 [Pantoea sp. MBD-2R]|uniref:hypothetical protein n=1 Tax=unclassified Pantoea TaxID=2630326 RepID=UPI0011BEBC13|nr:hypothetical protein [Pantoea sp. CCBC3-3-1]
MNGLSKFITLSIPAIFAVLLPTVQAETVTVSLSQEQDGGSAGRACMYIHQGKAEYRIVNAAASCPASVTVETHARRT